MNKSYEKELETMNQHDDVAWLRLQDMQREAQNRRLTAGGRPPALLAVLIRLLAPSPAGRGQAPETRQKLA